MMRFYQQQHPFYCGVDLHARTMHVCIVDQAANVLVHKNIECRPDRFLPLIGSPGSSSLLAQALACGRALETSSHREHCLMQRLTAQPQEMFGATRLRCVEGDATRESKLP